MIQRYIILLSLFIGSLLVGVPVFADKLTVSATVAPARTIYADANDNLIKLVSNTPMDIQPKVLVAGAGGMMDSNLGAQYQALLSEQPVGAGIYSLSPQAQAKIAAQKAFAASLAKLEFY